MITQQYSSIDLSTCRRLEVDTDPLQRAVGVRVGLPGAADPEWVILDASQVGAVVRQLQEWLTARAQRAI